MRFKVHFDFWADIESTIWHFEPILSRQFEISADIESKLRRRTRFMRKIAYEKCVNNPPKEFFSKVGHSRIVPYTKLKLHARNQQNIMNSYREITTSVFSLIQKSLRPLFLRKKPLTKIFFDPPKISPQTPQAFYSTVGPSPPSLLPPIPLETFIYIDPKKNLSEGPLPHGFWQIPLGNDYLSSGVRASTNVTHQCQPNDQQVTNMPTSDPTRLIFGRHD